MSTVTSGSILWSIPQWANITHVVGEMIILMTGQLRKQLVWTSKYAWVINSRQTWHGISAGGEYVLQHYVYRTWNFDVWEETEAQCQVDLLRLGNDGPVPVGLSIRPPLMKRKPIFLVTGQTAGLYSGMEGNWLHPIAYNVRDWSI